MPKIATEKTTNHSHKQLQPPSAHAIETTGEMASMPAWIISNERSVFTISTYTSIPSSSLNSTALPCQGCSSILYSVRSPWGRLRVRPYTFSTCCKVDTSPQTPIIFLWLNVRKRDSCHRMKAVWSSSCGFEKILFGLTGIISGSLVPCLTQTLFLSLPHGIYVVVKIPGTDLS